MGIMTSNMFKSYNRTVSPTQVYAAVTDYSHESNTTSLHPLKCFFQFHLLFCLLVESCTSNFSLAAEVATVVPSGPV